MRLIKALMAFGACVFMFASPASHSRGIHTGSQNGATTLVWDQVEDPSGGGDVMDLTDGGACLEGTINQNGEWVCQSSGGGGQGGSNGGPSSCAPECDHGRAWGRVMVWKGGRWKCEYPGTGTRGGLGTYNCTTGTHSH